MNKPRYPVGHADRFLACQETMEDHFNDIMDAAMSAGWSPAEASAAIADLADHYMLKLFAIEDTARQITAAIERQRSRGA